MDADEALDTAGGPELVAFARDYVALADQLLGPFDAGYLLGSIAAGEAGVGVSDLDVMLVTSRSVDATTRLAAGEKLADAAQPCPLNGVELVVYQRGAVARPDAALTYDLNVNGGRALDRNVSVAGEPGFWFVLDVSAARDSALTLFGPDPAALIGVVSADLVRAALAAALEWHLANAPATPDAVLNATRGWYWLEHGHWVSKVVAARWATTVDDRPVIQAALAARAAGRDGAVLDQQQVEDLQRDVLARTGNPA